MKLTLISMETLYKNNPELKPEDVAHIRDWMKTQSHLPEMTDQEIALSLHCRYFNIEAAKTQIDMNFTLRTHAKDLFSSRDILGDDLQMIKDVMVLMPLPETTPEGYRVLLWKLLDPDVTKFNYKAILKLCTMYYETQLLEDGPPPGYVIIVDIGNFTFKHLFHINLHLTKQAVIFMQDAYQGRLKGFCYFNLVPAFNKFIKMFTSLLNKEILSVLKIYETSDGLKEMYPLKILPKDYEGGEADSVKEIWEHQLQYLKDRREYFLEEEQTRRVNERLRPSKSPLDNQIFGLDGSFKKLDID